MHRGTNLAQHCDFELLYYVLPEIDKYVCGTLGAIFDHIISAAGAETNPAVKVHGFAAKGSGEKRRDMAKLYDPF